MITLSKKTLDLLRDESEKPAVHKAAADGSLTASHFSPELQASLAEDAKADGTGTVMVPQIISLVAQLLTLEHEPALAAHEPHAAAHKAPELHKK